LTESNILIVFLLAIVCPSLINAQVKGDNTFTIHASVSLTAIKMVLFENGYSLVGTDTTFLTTTSKELKSYAWSVKMMLVRTDTTVIIKAFAKNNNDVPLFGVTTVSDFEPLVYVKSKLSILRSCWAEIDKVAHALSPNVTYSTR
jgi:hypothetical protein